MVLCSRIIGAKVSHRLQELFKMNTPDLFPIGSLQLSPRLQWFKNHNVKTHEFTSTSGDEHSFSHLGFGRWVAFVGRMPNSEDEGIYAEGDTEDQAIVNLAIGMRWKLWNEEAAATKPLNAK
jgi:hypothetical protein